MKKVGILGGGQLGKMMLQRAADYPMISYVLEKSEDCPSAKLCDHFVKGSLMSEEDVYNFGKQVDVLTIEIEHVNVEALKRLEAEGTTVIPSPRALEIIQDKGLQKQHYQNHGIPSSEFVLVENLENHVDFLPAFQKARKFGYDGKGVQALHSAEDLNLALEGPSLLEKAVDIEKEIAVIVAKNQSGQLLSFPAVELVFDPELNLVDYLVSPANLTTEQQSTAESLAQQVVKSLDSPGLFAIEMFLSKSGEILVNETAPRTHNSGHHSIEGNITSQFDQQIRILLDLPLGDTSIVQPSAMINLLGAPEHQGQAKIYGLDKLLSRPGVYLHLYGKSQTKPGRKMGHITVLNEDRDALENEVRDVKGIVQIAT